MPFNTINKVKKLIIKAGRVSRRLLLAGVCATSVCMMSCERPEYDRSHHIEIYKTSPKLDYCEHLKYRDAYWGVRQYTVELPNGRGFYLRPALFRWDNVQEKYRFAFFLHVTKHEFK